MRFERKLYMVAMAIFAVLLCTSAVFAGMTATVVGGEGTVDPTSANDDATITIEPSSGYQVDKIILYEGVNNLKERGSVFEYCGSEDDKITCSATYDGLNVKFSYEKLNASYVLEASFEEIPTVTYTASNTSAGPYGVMTGPDDVTLLQGESRAYTVYEGASTTFAITPNEFCQVVDVFVDGTSIGAVPSYTFVDSTSNHTIKATFEPIPVVASFSADMASGDITTSDEVTFTPDPPLDNLTFWKWYLGNKLVFESTVPDSVLITFTESGDYTVTLEVGNTVADHSTSATYTVKSSGQVSVGGTGAEYGSIMEAYSVIPNAGETIKIKAGEITEDLVFNDTVTFFLKGGYDEWSGADSGYTKIKGTLRIAFGKVVVSRLIIAAAI